jgi:hypothetical protein
MQEKKIILTSTRVLLSGLLISCLTVSNHVEAIQSAQAFLDRK